MRENLSHLMEQWRNPDGFWASKQGDHHGLFDVPYLGLILVCLSSGIDPDDKSHWEHVSVSVHRRKGKRGLIPLDRTPTWSEMCVVKNLFWGPEETVIQFHPPESEYVNTHPHCLHLWKPPYAVPTPPSILIG